MSKEELNSMGKFLVSPIFNTNEKATQLFHLIKAHHPRYDSPDLSKDEVFRVIFPEKKVADSSLRALMSQLTNLVSSFFAFQEYNSRKFLKNELLVLSLMDRNLVDLLRKSLQSAQRELDKHHTRNTDIYFSMFRLSVISFEHDIVYKNREPGLSLKKVVNDLDTFFISSKLRYSAAALNRQSVIEEELNLSLFEEILDHVQESDLKQVPLIKLYYSMCLMLLGRNSEQQFFELRRLTREHRTSVDRLELSQVYTVLVNYCLMRLKEGKEEFLREMFNLYQEMIEFQLLKRSVKNMSPHMYRNIAMVAMRLKEFEWVENFMESYRNKIEQGHRKDVYHYLKAALSFEKGDYDRTKEYLIDFQLIDAFYHLHWKILMIKTSYELNETSAFDSAIEALRIYLLREKSVSRSNIQSCQRFVSLVKKLNRRKHSPQDKDLGPLIKEIEESTNTAALPWLRCKVAELKK